METQVLQVGDIYNKVKPILIARLPFQIFRNTSFGQVQESLKEHTNNEYHILTITSSDESEPRFEVISVKDIKELDVEELTKLIKEELAKNAGDKSKVHY